MFEAGAAGALEIREGGGAIRLAGAFPYGRAAELVPPGREGRGRREVFAPRAFAARIDAGEEVHLLAGHDYDRPLASRGAGTLTLRDAEAALEFEARIAPELAAAGYVRDLLAALRAGLVRGLSPGFRVPDDPAAEIVTDQGDALLRTVRAADLFELSIVTRPAYPSAQVEARSWRVAPERAQASHLNRWRL